MENFNLTKHRYPNILDTRFVTLDCKHKNLRISESFLRRIVPGKRRERVWLFGAFWGFEFMEPALQTNMLMAKPIAGEISVEEKYPSLSSTRGQINFKWGAIHCCIHVGNFQRHKLKVAMWNFLYAICDALCPCIAAFNLKLQHQLFVRRVLLL